MINKNEAVAIGLATLILAFVISTVTSSKLFLYTLLSVFIIIIVNIMAKKITSYYLDSSIEVRLWEIKRYGFKPKTHFKNPFPAGLFIPIILLVLSLGYFKWMASLTFDIKNKVHRAAKRHGLYSFSEISENHLGLIAASGVVVNLILAIAGYLIGYNTFAKLNIFYAFFNLLPLSDLDGNKIFFGSLILWSFLASITLIGLAYVFLVI